MYASYENYLLPLKQQVFWTCIDLYKFLQWHVVQFHDQMYIIRFEKNVFFSPLYIYEFDRSRHYFDSKFDI